MPASVTKRVGIVGVTCFFAIIVIIIVLIATTITTPTFLSGHKVVTVSAIENVSVINRSVSVYVGVADQLQTNYASDLRHMLKSVFDSFTSDIARLDAAEDVDAFHHRPTTTESSLSSHLPSRSITSDETSPNNNHHPSATSMLGMLLA